MHFISAYQVHYFALKVFSQILGYQITEGIRYIYNTRAGIQLSTVDLVIYACLDFRECVPLGLFTRSRINDFDDR